MTLNPKSWRNNDGLNVWFGPKEGTSTQNGEVLTYGDNRALEYVLTLTDLTSTAQYIDEGHTTLPRGVFIEQVELVVLTAATSGGSATLNLGLSKDDDTTNVSDTALVSALALASINTVGQKVTLNVGSTSVGSSVGGTTPTDLATILTGKWGTAAFTAGVILVRILWNTAGQKTAIMAGTTSPT